MKAEHILCDKERTLQKMRKKIWLIIMLMAVTCFACEGASANSWGLNSESLLKFVMKDRNWDDYSADAEFYQRGTSLTAAVMSSKYHSVLMVGNSKGDVWLSTTAVFQPGEIKGAPILMCTEDTVILYYPDYEYEFTFKLDSIEYPGTVFVLIEGKKGVHVTADLETRRYWDGEETYWQVPLIRMESFNVSLFPESAEQIAEMNRVYAALNDASGFWDDSRSTKKSVKLPVYSAPDSNSYRAAKGKASVNLKGGVNLMATLNSWDLVEYEVSTRTHRIGWIEGNHLGDPAPISFTDVPVSSVEYITDDPLCSQYKTFMGAELTDVHLLAYLNPFYAYAKAETGNGQTIWGFVPIGLGLELPEAKVDDEIMTELSGTWVFYSGGELTSQVLRLKKDGTCEMLGLSETAADSLAWLEGHLSENMLDSSTEPTVGTWRIIDSIADNGCDKTLIIKVDNTYQSFGIYDLQNNETTGDLCMTLVYGEAGGTWARVQE